MNSCCSFTNTTTLLPAHTTTVAASPHSNHHNKSPSTIRASVSSQENQNPTNRRKILTTFAATSLGVVGLHGVGNGSYQSLAESWGTRSFLKEKFFEPGLSPEDAVARIKQTAEGLHSLREMLDRMAWRYVIFYIRLKSAYLSQDLTNAMSTLPQSRRNDYVKTANELVDNMAEVN